MSRTIDSSLLRSQLSLSQSHQKRLWKELLHLKIKNQWSVLEHLELPVNPLTYFKLRDNPNEGAAARDYWQHFFRSHGNSDNNRSQRYDGPINKMLNYGYAVLLALVFRSTVIHGLIPSLGIHHRYRYRSNPLIYDLMEPLRPFVDFMLSNFLKNLTKEFVSNSNSTSSDENLDQDQFVVKEWINFVGKNLKDYRVQHSRYSLKLMDSIDIYIRSFAQIISNRGLSTLWIPEIKT